MAQWQVSYHEAYPPLAMLAAAALGAGAAAGAITRADGTWSAATTILAAGLGLVAATATWIEFGPAAAEMSSVLVILGAGMAAYGVLADRLRFVEGAVVVWLAAALAALDNQFDLSLHVAVVITSVTLLTVIEVERLRLRRTAAEPPPVLATVEWVFLVAPLAFGAIEVLSRLWFSLVLLAEGVAMTTWGVRSEVRRRVLIGFSGIVLAILLAVIVPVAEGVRAGLTGEAWLAVGAVAAVVFLTIGSVIERKRTAINEQIKRIWDIMEGWE